MNRLRHPVYGLCLVLVSAGLLLAHPHFNKTLIVKLPGGADATLIYNTVPANETHAKNAAVGSFVTPRQPKLRLSAEVKAGAVTIPAGEYVVGVIKNGDNDWTMALYPGSIPRGAQPDMSKMLKLESEYSTSAGKSAHLLIDIAPGEGKLQGKAALIVHFGSMHLSGALS